MKTKKTLMFWVALILATNSLIAQSTLNGVVLDKENKQALPGAHVYLQNSYRATSTKSYGGFQFQNIDGDSIRLKVSFIGYETFEKTLKIEKGVNNLEILLSPKTFTTEEFIVSSTKAQKNSPTPFVNLDKDKIAERNLGQDLPFLLNFTPSVVVSSDAGNGVGYTGISIRGSDPTRTNVTINGIPINDSESHGVFWVNMPDFASSTNNIQIQRGVGTSTNGAAAFGATMNLETNQLNEQAYGEVNSSFGSFNTLKNNVMFGSGLIDGKFAFDGRLSAIKSDGFIDRASSDLKSYYFSGAYYGKKSVLKFITFAGKEKTYQAWNGVPQDSLATNRTYNSAGEYIDENGNVKYYDNEVDDYQQTHYQLHYTYQLNRNWNFNAAAHYTYGRGFYEQFRRNDRFSTYGFQTLTQGGTNITFRDSLLINGTDTIVNNNPGVDTTVTVGQQIINRTDLIRRRWLENHFYGITYSANYNSLNKLSANIGGGFNIYDGDHFGEVIWARFAANSDIRDRYYDNNGTKKDFNIYGKLNYELSEKFNVFLDLQYRFISYDFIGKNVVNEEIFDTKQNATFSFFNPKAGFTYKLNDKSALFAYTGVSNREPVRRDFTESTPDSRPQHETMVNYELGYQYKGNKTMLNVNAYLMDYFNQLVLTGELNDVGGSVRDNVDRSFRRGVEFDFSYLVMKNLRLNANLTLSQNKIQQFNEFIDDFETGEQIKTAHKNTNIAYSPNIISGTQITYLYKGFEASFLPKYVGKQYLDNTQNESRTINAYLVNDVLLTYNIKSKYIKNIRISLLINNILDAQYSANGWTYSYALSNQVYTDNAFFPQAGRNFLAGLSLKF
jgi:iron complex outermembrane recepter protein